MNDYKSAFNAAAADISAIIALLGFTKYPGVDPVLRAIADLILEKAESQVLREERDAANKRADTLEHRMMGMMTRHFAEAWHNRDTQKALDGYLSAGIAQLEQAEQAEAERPEVVGVRYEDGTILSAEDCGTALEVCAKVQTPLMTVAQHERIVGALRFERQQMDRAFTACINERDAADARLHEVATACATAEEERDAALARVAELERQQPVAWMHDQPNRVDVIHRDVKDLLQRVPGSSRGIYRPLDVSEHYTIPLYAAPVAQAQHSVPEISGIGRDAEHPRAVVLYLRNEPSEEDMRAIQNFLRAISADVLTQAQHSVPDGWLIELGFDVLDRQFRFADAKSHLPTIKIVLPACEVDDSAAWELRNSVAARIEKLIAAAPGNSVPQAWLDVQAERRRQITAEGWTPEHDDEHDNGEMARAAACYALAGSSAPSDGTAALLVSLAWPWDEQWWKPSTARRDMVKACALGLAEIERLDRVAASQGGPSDA